MTQHAYCSVRWPPEGKRDILWNLCENAVVWCCIVLPHTEMFYNILFTHTGNNHNWDNMFLSHHGMTIFTDELTSKQFLNYGGVVGGAKRALSSRESTHTCSIYKSYYIYCIFIIINYIRIKNKNK